MLGLMSGTSHDGIDGAVVEFTPQGEGLIARVVTHVSAAYEPGLRDRLVTALPPAPTTLAEVTRLDTQIGQAFAELAARAVEGAGPMDLVASHGQTVFHWVEPASESSTGTPSTPAARGTLQLGQPAWIAEATGAPVLADVRARDIAAGGHGAPLVGLLDELLLADRVRAGARPAALNLGGIANVSVVEDAGVRAWDTGPANALMDAVVRDRGAHPQGYDADGALAAAGSVHAPLLESLLADPYYRQAPPKSTGKELFHLDYLRAVLARTDTEALPIEDLLATLAELTVHTVARALHDAGVSELYASGGGARNPVLMSGLRRALPSVQVRSSADLGVGEQEKEALLMALLGWYAWHGLPASMPASGARGPRLLGSLTPGAGPLRLPEPREQPPAWLRVG
ncbi:anhydro-N-acetylmuramic acid kinase [Bogoriella caseilytica]|uniref:anhydro-N-acetylmuramic acid kinase n=1 Tax=Bogoriella caseilytica TaxID=56055 RepID=UPI002482D215|nr:anhydro-N-acetylmuramic acid kinase [Bogoriella caseilytica]